MTCPPDTPHPAHLALFDPVANALSDGIAHRAGDRLADRLAHQFRRTAARWEEVAAAIAEHDGATEVAEDRHHVASMLADDLADLVGSGAWPHDVLELVAEHVAPCLDWCE